MKRSKPIPINIPALLAWQARSRQAAWEAQKSKPRRFARRARSRRNDGPWRRECLEKRGEWCRVPRCPHPQPVQMDHLIPRSQGGASVVENGLPLCRVHHDMKTAHDLLVDPAWLDPDQVLWLSDHGHTEWLWDGVVIGRHRKLFTDGPDRRCV